MKTKMLGVVFKLKLFCAGLLIACAVSVHALGNFCGDGLITSTHPASYGDFINLVHTQSVKNEDVMHKAAAAKLSGLNKSQVGELIALFNKFPPFLTSRHYSSDFNSSDAAHICAYLQQGRIDHSTGENTPDIEKKLYSADQCVFLSYGTYGGASEYFGDAVFIFKTDNKNFRDSIWLTERDGLAAMENVMLGFEPPSGNYDGLAQVFSNQGGYSEPNDMERSYFLNHAYTYDQWSSLMQDVFINRLRFLNASDQLDVYKILTASKDARSFYDSLAKLKEIYPLIWFQYEAHINYLPLNSKTLAKIILPKKVISNMQTKCADEYSKYSKYIVEAQ